MPKDVKLSNATYRMQKKLKVSKSSCVDEEMRKGLCRPAARHWGAAAALIREERDSPLVSVKAGKWKHTRQLSAAAWNKNSLFPRENKISRPSCSPHSLSYFSALLLLEQDRSQHFWDISALGAAVIQFFYVKSIYNKSHPRVQNHSHTFSNAN